MPAMLKLGRGVRHLVRTHAPLAVIASYVSWQFKKRSVVDRYMTPREDFRREIGALNFSNDWFTPAIPFWLWTFERFKLGAAGRVRVLEIGSWEGLSSRFLLSRLPAAELTCVDTWQGGDEHVSGDLSSHETLGEIETKFDANLAPFAGRVRKAKLTSFAYFAQRKPSEEPFDLIYVDGSHFADDVMIDALKSFEALKPGGLLIFDDYLWDYYPCKLDGPAAAINAFLALKRGKYRLVAVYAQLIIQKLEPQT